MKCGSRPRALGAVGSVRGVPSLAGVHLTRRPPPCGTRGNRRHQSRLQGAAGSALLGTVDSGGVSLVDDVTGASPTRASDR
jgi:hypothetical protein